MRGLASSGTVNLGGDVHVLLEHSNRGKQSLGLDLTSEEGLDVLYKLAKTCDVFLTNKLAAVRTKLKIDVDDIKAANPDIIYVRGSGQGEKGPDADKGSYDSLAYWCRAGVAIGVKQHERRAAAAGSGVRRLHRCDDHRRRDHGRPLPPVATPARPPPSTCRSSAPASGRWVRRSPCRCSSSGAGPPSRPGRPPTTRSSATTAPRTTSSCRWPASRPAKYWPEACEIVGRPELADRRALRRHRVDHRQRLGRPRPAGRGVRPAHRRRVAREARAVLRPVDRRPGHAGGRRRPSVGGQRLRPGLRDGRRPHVPARRRPGAVRRRGGQARRGRRSSTSTATPSSRASASTWTPSSTSRSRASSPEPTRRSIGIPATAGSAPARTRPSS